MSARLLEHLAKRLVSHGLKKGATEGSFLWIAVAVFGFLLKFVLKQRKPKIITEKLHLGESILISHVSQGIGTKSTKKIY